MSDDHDTRSTLLLRIRDANDNQAWLQFVEIYSPLIHRFGLRNGLQDADAADLTQEVLRAVARTIGQWTYDPQVGRFRSWLFTVARNKLSNQLLSQRRHPQGSGDTGLNQMLDNQPAPNDGTADWDREYEQRLFHWAAEQVRGQFQEASWEAFWRTAVENQPVKDVAESLGLSAGAVYIAKSRVLARLKEKIQELGER